MFVYILIASATLLLFYLNLIKPYHYWKTRNVKYIQPLPFFGNMCNLVFRKMCVVDMMKQWYQSFNNQRYFGIYQFTTPVLIVKDPELIKDMAIKDFNHFHDHRAFSSEDDILWSKNLFARNGDDWRDMRATLSPSFTGTKMRAMFALINDCAKQMISHFLAKKEDVITFEVKDSFTRFTNDVIATCAFGVTCDSFNEPQNEFYNKGFEATDFSGFRGLKLFLHTLCPTLMKLLGIKILSRESESFFYEIIRNTIKFREEQGIIRPDMINLLMEARKQRQNEGNQKEEITVEDITAQAFIFFAAGFDTTSTLMMYIAYELATNKECQDKLIKEIDEANLKGELTYESVTKLKYLDMVTSETLRLWPPSIIADRKCTANYVIDPKNENENIMTVEKGTYIWFPVFCTHRDPEYFPNPDTFDPERFSDENKDAIIPGTYLPFGIGPRICIGNRFALMETKAVIYQLLLHFEFVTVEKSVVPVKLSKIHFNLNAENGMWLGLKRRQ